MYIERLWIRAYILNFNVSYSVIKNEKTQVLLCVHKVILFNLCCLDVFLYRNMFNKEKVIKNIYLNFVLI